MSGSRGSSMSGNDAEFVSIARVVKTQGRIGEVAAAVITELPERFESRKKLYAFCAGKRERRELQMEDHWFHKGQVVLKFAGVDSISQAEELVGCEIQVPMEERAELEEGAFYVSDLTGCTVYDAGRELGKINDVQFGSGEAPRLVVQGDKEYLVPFAAGYIKALSLETKRLDMELPEGMLELDALLDNEEKQRQKESGRR